VSDTARTAAALSMTVEEYLEGQATRADLARFLLAHIQAIREAKGRPLMPPEEIEDYLMLWGIEAPTDTPPPAPSPDR
jgi:hypothetical protein